MYFRIKYPNRLGRFKVYSLQEATMSIEEYKAGELVMYENKHFAY